METRVKALKSSAVYLLIAAFAMMSALNYKLFVFSNSFAPSGIDGICTMIQYLTKTNIGYLALIFNIPLLALGFWLFKIKGEYIIKTALYISAFSLFSILLGYIDLSRFVYSTESGTSIVLAPIAAGVIRGILYHFTLMLGGSSGGVDIIAQMVKNKRPHYNLMNIIFGFNVVIALCAYFVYSFKVEPVICSIIYSFVTSTVTKGLDSLGNERVKFEIITPDVNELCTLITSKLNASATVIDAHGAFSGADKKMLICVIGKDKTPKLEELLRDFKDTVVFKSVTNSSI